MSGVCKAFLRMRADTNEPAGDVDDEKKGESIELQNAAWNITSSAYLRTSWHADLRPVAFLIKYDFWSLWVKLK